MTLKILILGVNGFIGSSLAEQVLQNTDWEIHGMDLASHKLGKLVEHPRMQLKIGDILANADWIEEQIKICDVVLPLVAIANPAIYVQDPLRVFELDFEANLHTVRLCVKHHKRVIFPSTSEVYGMCTDNEFDEETSLLVQGPINKPRWIYSCAKQMMDRVIHAYGIRGILNYTLFRPFNWMGPKLDDINNLQAGGSRALTQFIGNILRGENISMVNGGMQRRSFTYIDDGIAALIKIIENKNQCAEKQIFNIGNPNNDISIRELAELLIKLIKTYPQHAATAEKTQLIHVASAEYFGAGYQDVGRRVPSIKKAQQQLGWHPTVNLETALKKTLNYYLL